MAPQIARIEEFVCRYFSLQQTALAENMLYEDKHMDMLFLVQPAHAYSGIIYRNIHGHT